MASRTILLAAGGTGGHLFPAEALAHELIARGWELHLATDDRVGRFSGSFPAKQVHPIVSSTIGSKNPFALAKAFWTIFRGVRQSSAVIRAVNPAVVVGFGGYPTLPPVYAATRRGVPTLLHEQNAVMGRANKALAERVTAIAGGFLDNAGNRHAAKTVLTGNPVRPAVLEAAKTPYQAAGVGAPFHFVVFGGSQGAQFFSDAVPEAVAALSADLRGRLRITQQARQEDAEKVRATYERLGVPAEVSPFFKDLAARVASAQLVMSRSGASTVSEIAVIGRPALLVPYPYALDHDQAANAAALAKAGGAELHDQSTLGDGAITRLLAAAMTEPGRLSAMAAAAKGAGRPDAARLLADLTEAIASGTSIAAFKEAANT